MKSIHLIILILALSSTSSFAQNENVPVPEFMNSIYVINNDKLIQLENQDAKLDIKVKNKIFSMSSKGSYKLRNSKSNVRFSTNKIKFIFEPSIMIDVDFYVKAVKLITDEKNNSRELIFDQTKMSIAGSSNSDLQNQNIQFKYKKYKEKYIILEIENLEKGEYGIYIGAPIKMQLFGVDL